MARFRDSPLWPAHVVKLMNQSGTTFRYTVIRYGSHDLQNFFEANLLDFEENHPIALKINAIGVKNAFHEYENYPDIYIKIIKWGNEKRGNREKT